MSATPRACRWAATSRGAPAGKAPTFLVAALKDPIGANLDRIQIIKGWLDAKGETHEKVYDVVWSDAATRKPGADGKLPAVGNTVDVADATWSNTIGDSELITVWKDPDFDASAVRLLLRAGDRDSDPALDSVRREVFQADAPQGSPDDHDRARLHLAHLVQPGEVRIQQEGTEITEMNSQNSVFSAWLLFKPNDENKIHKCRRHVEAAGRRVDEITRRDTP